MEHTCCWRPHVCAVGVMACCVAGECKTERHAGKGGRGNQHHRQTCSPHFALCHRRLHLQDLCVILHLHDICGSLYLQDLCVSLYLNDLSMSLYLHDLDVSARIPMPRLDPVCQCSKRKQNSCKDWRNTDSRQIGTALEGGFGRLSCVPVIPCGRISS